jgi:hypothetical protein
MNWSQARSVAVVTSITMLANQGLILRRGMNRSVCYDIPTAVGPGWPAVQWVSVKQPGVPYSAKVKNVWGYASTPPYIFMASLFHRISTGTTFTFD